MSILRSGIGAGSIVVVVVVVSVGSTVAARMQVAAPPEPPVATEIGLETIMADPDWLGRPPESP